jgi:hypothetical protein
MEKTTATPSPEAFKAPEQLYAEREDRIQQAVQLKQPDRIPIMLPMSYMLAEIGGITKQELHDNPEKAQMLLEKAALKYQPDSLFGLFPPDPRPHLLLGDRMTLFPGHGLNPNSEYQFVEKEFMKAEDYDEFLEDPADWAIRVYLPRVFSGLEGFSLLPPLGTFLFGSYNLINLSAFTAPPLVASFQTFAKAVQATAEEIALAVKNIQRMSALGFSSGFVVGSIIVEAPFDFMSDTLRGMRGIMLDMFKRPDQLLAAEEKVSRFQLKFAVDFSRATGVKSCFIPLHRGSDGFMSLSQFEKFYWPQLKNMLLVLIENGITPYVFYEGIWDQRLNYLAELPRGKTAGWFQASDIFKVKEIAGNTMCIIGGMPNAMLASGTVEEVRERTRKLCNIVGKGGGFIMSTGVGEMSGSKPELVKAWVDATRQYGTY